MPRIWREGVKGCNTNLARKFWAQRARKSTLLFFFFNKKNTHTQTKKLLEFGRGEFAFCPHTDEARPPPLGQQ